MGLAANQVPIRSRSRVAPRDAHALQVRADAGTVILSGPVLRRELEGLIEIVHKVRGVTRVENNLEVREQAGSEPGLQN